MTDASTYWTLAQTAIDDLVTDLDDVLGVDEDTLADEFTNSQRDLLAKAKYRAEEARKLLDDITLRSLTDQSL